MDDHVFLEVLVNLKRIKTSFLTNPVETRPLLLLFFRFFFSYLIFLKDLSTIVRSLNNAFHVNNTVSVLSVSDVFFPTVRVALCSTWLLFGSSRNEQRTLRDNLACFDPSPYIT